jgi:hypothetical protein
VSTGGVTWSDKAERAHSPTLPVSTTAWRVAAVLSVIAAWLLARPYNGIVHDARHYMGEALARLSPRTVGEDYMFALDGQFGFTIFGHVSASLTQVVGVGGASMLIVAAGLGLWVAAAFVFTGRLASGRLRWASLIALASLPADYAAYNGYLTFAEALATPRVFAEASVLAALALFLLGRSWLAVVFIVLAAAFHPVMALPGAGVMVLALAAEDRRWLWAPALGLAVAVAAAALGAPVAERLFQSIDPLWAGVVETRSTLVFPSQWEHSNFTRIGVHVATVLCAALLTTGRTRRVLLAIVGVALLGLAAGLLLGDVFRSLLVIQVQPWRALWLLAVVAAACLPICAVRLWSMGWTARVVIGGIVLGWSSLGEPVYGLASMAAVAAGGWALWRGRSLPVAPVFAATLFALAAVRGLAPELVKPFAIGVWAQSLPQDFSSAPLWWLRVPSLGLALTVAAIVLAIAPAPRFRWAPLVATGVAAVSILLTAFSWDARLPSRRAIEDPASGAELRRFLERRPGEVLWLAGDVHAWIQAGRPNWWAAYQCAPTVFSRPLTVTWSSRHQALVDAGLVTPYACVAPVRMTPEQHRAPRPVVTPQRLERFCRRSDAPAWMIVPVMKGAPTPSNPAFFWRPPHTEYETRVTDRGYVWRARGGYAVYPCARA